MIRTSLPAIVCCGVLVVASIAIPAAQRRTPGQQKSTVGVTIALKAGAASYQFTGPARCTHAPVGSIYGIVAEQFSVEQSEGARSTHLTFWKPKTGSGEMFSLSVSSDKASHTVNTVKASGAPAPQGSGKVTLSSSGSGGTFTIEAKASDGAVITGTIKCDAFLPAVAEGGL